MSKIYTVIRTTSGFSGSKKYTMTGTLEELIKSFSYTLEVGSSYEDEKGNKKVNRNPKSIKGLISALNNAAHNRAANFQSDYYSLGE